jgi:glycosyltransferase involved in cell wall biosynthesis
MTKKKLKIAIFHLAFLYSGGGEKLVLQEMRELEKRGHDVTCFTPTLDAKSCYPDIIGKYKIKPIFPGFRKLFRNHESLEIFATCLLFPFIAGRFKNYDVTIGANQPGPWLSYLVKKITGVPYIVYLAQPTRLVYPRKIDKECEVWLREKSYFLPFVSFFGKKFIWLADRVSIENASNILVNGKYIGNVLEKIYGKKVVICPAGADIVKSPGNYPIREKNGQYILVTNRHFPQKKFEYGIRAMPQVIKKVSNVKLIISGNFTEYSKRLITLADSMGLSDSVVFTGYLDEKKMKSLYSGASVYIYTSPEEDFGMGVIEAMAAGVPVVAWNKGGPSKTIINGKTGFLIEPYNEQEYANKIIWLLLNKKQNICMGENARAHVYKNFTLKNHVDILENSLMETVKKK